MNQNIKPKEESFLALHSINKNFEFEQKLLELIGLCKPELKNMIDKLGRTA